MWKPTRASWSRPASDWPESASISAASSASSSTSSDSNFASRNTESAGATRARSRAWSSAVGQARVVGVEHVDERLGGEQAELAQDLRRRAGGVEALARGEQRLARAEDLLGELGDREHGGVGLLAADLLLQPRHGLLQGLQVRQDQLGVDGLDVVGRVDAAGDVDHVVVGEGAHHLADRVGLADVGQELVAQALALARALDDARRCPRTTPSRARSARTRTGRTARPGAGRAAAPRRRSARWSRTGSSRRARRCGSGR